MEPSSAANLIPSTYNRRKQQGSLLPNVRRGLMGGFSLLAGEGGESERETLLARLVDRALRPLCDCGFQSSLHVRKSESERASEQTAPAPRTHSAVPRGHLVPQITLKLLCGTGPCEPTIEAIHAASAALLVANVPFEGPIGVALPRNALNRSAPGSGSILCLVLQAQCAWPALAPSGG
jgi:hypothetical protein